jgi:PleD family two-component response regulator
MERERFPNLPEAERLRVENEQLKLEVEYLKRKNKELEEFSTKDPLTGAYNRRGFEEEFGRVVGRNMPGGERERRGRPPQPVTLLLLDIDDFKKINDVHGHPAGDEVLKKVTAELRALLRDSDILARFGAELEEEQGAIGRHGGDEIVALVPGVDEATFSERLQKGEGGVPQLPFSIEVGGAPVTFSAGIATVFPNETAEAAIGRADDALYAAKSAGKNQIKGWGEL